MIPAPAVRHQENTSINFSIHLILSKGMNLKTLLQLFIVQNQCIKDFLGS